MKILEMRPRSYDRRMDQISRGRLRAVKKAVASEILRGSHVLEIGCGTGELADLTIKRGCTVVGFDSSPGMLEAAEERIKRENLQGKFFLRRMGVEGMDGFAGANFDAVVSTLVFSELNDNERRFALKQAARVLKPGGRIIIADEVVAQGAARRLIHTLLRVPLVAVTYLVSAKTTRPIEDLAGEVREGGFTIKKEVRSRGDAFAMVVGMKKGGDAT